VTLACQRPANRIENVIVGGLTPDSLYEAGMLSILAS